jgi:hypothetical protein
LNSPLLFPNSPFLISNSSLLFLGQTHIPWAFLVSGDNSSLEFFVTSFRKTRGSRGFSAAGSELASPLRTSMAPLGAGFAQFAGSLPRHHGGSRGGIRISWLARGVSRALAPQIIFRLEEWTLSGPD